MKKIAIFLSILLFMGNLVANAQTKTITLLVSGNTQLDLNEYAIRIYESYGISAYDNSETRWIIEEPEVAFLSDVLMEVTITYA